MSQWGAQGAALQGRTADQILDFYYPGTSPYDIGQDYPLRVLLTALAGASALAGPVAGASLVVTDLATGASATAPVGAQVRVTKSAAGFIASSVQSGTATALSLGGTTSVVGPIRLSGSAGTQVWTYQGDGSGTRYIGSLRLVAAGTDRLDVINDVPMEQYLRGVVPREVSASWAPAALQAQAIAARTYALAVRTPAASSDLCDTTACQVYGGSARSSASGVVTELHHANTDAAIAATARFARYYGGGPAFTQFSATNGGYSKAGSRPYLVARADPYTGTAPGDTRTRWSGTLSVSRVQQSCPAGGTLQRMVLVRDGNGDLGGRITSARLECSTGTSTVSTPAFGLLSSWWRPTSVGNPFGNLEAVDGASGGVTVTGWAVDPDTAAPIDVRVTYGGQAKVLRADGRRPDIGAAFPHLGPAHGFDITYPSAPGTTDVCVTALNVGPGADVELGCRSIVVAAGGPYGSVDAATGVPGSVSGSGGVRVQGWAVDPDVGTGSIQVEVLLDGVLAATVLADVSRPDVGSALPGMGSLHGYVATVPAAPGSHLVCVRAVNQPAGRNPVLGCSSAVVPGGSPTGNFETASGVAGGIAIAGWALDPDTTAPVYVWVEVAGTGRHVLANQTRNDVAGTYPAYGAARGFRSTIPAAPGRQQVCVTLSNIGTGGHTPLGCREVVVPDSSPTGNFEAIAGVPGGVQLTGWALDPETTSPIYVWAHIPGRGGPLRAAAARADVERVYPGSGPYHGFVAVLPADPGVQTVCLTAINVGQGMDRSLGCRQVTVPGGPPFGMVETVTARPRAVTVTGWAIDPDTTASGYVWVNISGVGQPIRANVVRSDVGAAFPAYGSAHGYSATIPAMPGLRSVCLIAVNIGAGHDTPLRCVDVVVPPG